jgi:hypothetical protein
LGEVNVVDEGEKCKRILPPPQIQSASYKGIGLQLYHTLYVREHCRTISRIPRGLSPKPVASDDWPS